MNNSLLVIAAEVSGDVHASDVIQTLKKRGANFDEYWGIGGDLLRAEGVELLQDVRDMSVMGIVEILKSYRFFKQVFNQVLGEVDRRKPKAALLVDYPGFNLRLAAKLKKRGVKVYYYISPKVWAWNKRRIPKMAKIIDQLFVIFPFEIALFEGTGLKVDYVGNPLVAQLNRVLAEEPKPLPWKCERRVALLPGSRKQEIIRILPPMLAAAYDLEKSNPQLSFIIATPTEQVKALVQKVSTEETNVPKNLTIILGDAREVMRQAEAGIVTSGTATLEAALLGMPLIIVYKTSLFTYWFARTVLTIRHIGLTNIIMGKTICPELIQQQASVENLVMGMQKLLEGSKDRSDMLREYDLLHQCLGGLDASEEVAKMLCET